MSLPCFRPSQYGLASGVIGWGRGRSSSIPFLSDRARLDPGPSARSARRLTSAGECSIPGLRRATAGGDPAGRTWQDHGHIEHLKGDRMEYRVVSADDHIDLQWLPRDLWQARVPAAYRERVPRVVDTAEGPWWMFGDERWDSWGGRRGAAGAQGGRRNALERGGVLEHG